MAQVSADFATLTGKCASEMVKAIVSDVADLAQTYAPQGQLWSESVRETAAVLRQLSMIAMTLNT